MALYRISDRDPNYQASYFGGGDLKGMSVYSAEGKKVAQVLDILVDDTGCIKYLVIRLLGLLGISWPVRCTTVILSVSSYAHNSAEDAIYVHTLSKVAIASLPPYDKSHPLDDAYEAELGRLTKLTMGQALKSSVAPTHSR